MKHKLFAGRWLAVVLALCMVLPLAPTTAFAEGRSALAQDASPITNIEILYATLFYKAGEAPRISAHAGSPEEDDVGYEVYDEYWEEMELDGSGESVAVRYWHSNLVENAKVSEDKRITTFEAGKSYMYSLTIKTTEGRSFADDCTMTLNGTAVNQRNVIKVDDCTRFAIALKTIRPTNAETVSSIAIENAVLNYAPGEKPEASATVGAADAAKYAVAYECWEKCERGENDAVETVAYWYSDESRYTSVTPRFTTFEKGFSYRYKIYLKVKDGYAFQSDLQESTVSLNGGELPWGSFVTSMDNGQGCCIQYGTNLRPGDSVKKICINDATLQFEPGDKPAFTGQPEASAPYCIDHEGWLTDDGGVTSSDFWNSRYGDFEGSWGKLVEAFEDGKTYSYDLYIKLTSDGYNEGWCFDKDTGLCINGRDIDLSKVTVDLDESGETIWFHGILTLTPGEGPAVRRGDVDDDNYVTVSDVVALRQLIVAGSWTDREFAAGNLDDSDENLTVSDVVALRALIVSGV